MDEVVLFIILTLGVGGLHSLHSLHIYVSNYIEANVWLSFDCDY